MPDAPLPFDHARAHALYKALFGEVADLIKGKHLLLVPSGPLTQLPFQVLVTAPPTGSDHKSIRWLARDHAMTVLPAVSSLKALRRVAKPSAATQPMIGFGNPLLDGDQSHPQFSEHYKSRAALARATQSCPEPTQLHNRSARGGFVRRAAQRGSDLDTGRAWPISRISKRKRPCRRRPRSCALSRAISRPIAASIRLGARATEREIKRLSAATDATRLANYRIVHFATHGTLAGQLSGTSEPGLILTPPDTATAEDDGYLSAGEIAGLKLDADWVILSACNTAGAASTACNGRRSAVRPGARVLLCPGPRAAGLALGGRQRRHREADHPGGRRHRKRQDGRPRRGAAPRHAGDDRQCQ